MHIVIEGFDGTGKSTLAQLLAASTGWPVVHQSPYRPANDAAFEAARYKALATAMNCRDLISDRWPDTTDYCYRSTRYFGDLDTVAEALRTARVSRIIHCDVDHVDDLRIRPRPGDARDEEQTQRVQAMAERVLTAYRDLMNSLRASGFRVSRYVALADDFGLDAHLRTGEQWPE